MPPPLPKPWMGSRSECCHGFVGHTGTSHDLNQAQMTPTSSLEALAPLLLSGGELLATLLGWEPDQVACRIGSTWKGDAAPYVR